MGLRQAACWGHAHTCKAAEHPILPAASLEAAILAWLRLTCSALSSSNHTTHASLLREAMLTDFRLVLHLWYFGTSVAHSAERHAAHLILRHGAMHNDTNNDLGLTLPYGPDGTAQ